MTGVLKRDTRSLDYSLFRVVEALRRKGRAVVDTKDPAFWASQPRPSILPPFGFLLILS